MDAFELLRVLGVGHSVADIKRVETKDSADFAAGKFLLAFFLAKAFECIEFFDGGCPRPLLAVTDFRYFRLPWLDGRCVQGPGTYSPRHG